MTLAQGHFIKINNVCETVCYGGSGPVWVICCGAAKWLLL